MAISDFRGRKPLSAEISERCHLIRDTICWELMLSPFSTTVVNIWNLLCGETYFYITGVSEALTLGWVKHCVNIEGRTVFVARTTKTS